MSPRFRALVFLVAASGLLSLFIWGVLGLAPFGHYPGPYGDILNAVAVPERHVLNVVTAVIFDYRGFDTLGEEFILFACVTGVTLLLRHEGKSEEEECAPRPGLKPPPNGAILPEATEATRLCSAGCIGLILVFGIYIILTGHLSLGGGFQGGVLLSSAWLLLFLAYGTQTLHRFSNKYVVEWFESSGAGAYVLIGLAGLVFGRNFLANILPLGEPGQLLSSGTILLINCGVGVEVTAGFILLLLEFVKPLEPEKPLR
jgi:multicomponent Na+:H+ antiporter subunit B